MLVTLLAGLLGPTSVVQAFCGFYAGKADSSLFNEASQVVVVRDGPKTVITMLNDYKGPMNEFALVVPTPTVLQKGQVQLAHRRVFDRLDAYSSPRLAEYHDSDPCRLNFSPGPMQIRMDMLQMAPASAPMAKSMRSESERSRDRALGVTVELQYSLGEYEIVNLSATQSDGLEQWLRENGYSVPKGAATALRPYLNMGMKFFVAKVNLKEQARVGFQMLSPLQFAFDSEKFMLPMRLGMLNAAPDKSQDLIVYALTKQGRVESSNYRTVKLPANVNLPAQVKPRFQDFYKSMFSRQALQEDHRVVFTEYFWDMSWCDPCADNPLTPQELKQAGVFWAEEGGPTLLTRMHVRYNAQSFPEDLMFTQTRDRQNWQTRYVVQNPFKGSMNDCSNKMTQTHCETICAPHYPQASPKADSVTPATPRPNLTPKPGEEAPRLRRAPSGQDSMQSCVQACAQAKQQSLATAWRYYEHELPARLLREKQTLSQLTGWSMSQIDGFDQGFGVAGPVTPVTPVVPVVPVVPVAPTSSPKQEPWWQRLFRSQGSAS
jgi:hypothetical protein